MDNQIREAFDAVQASERLKRMTKANLRKATFDYGRNVLQIRSRRRRIVAAMLSLVLVLTGSGLWFFPAASISMDINPSIELKVNAFDRVIEMKGRNSDGKEIVKDLNVDGMAYDDAVQRILLSQKMRPYLENNQDITITVAGGTSEQHAEKMLSRVLCRASNIAKDKDLLYCKVDWETVRAAREAGLCIPRYLAWQNLLVNDPTITVEDVREIPKEKIRLLAQVIIIEDPCHE